MILIDLPEEILVTIIKKLDIKSVCSLYETCTYFKQVILQWHVVQECRLSMNTMASAKMLKLDFFKDISAHLKELNLCCVPDLCKSVLLPASKKLKKLKTLDVSYTKITMDDCIQILKLCPTIKNIAINFMFSEALYSGVEIDDRRLNDLQNVFQQISNVHFVGSVSGLLISKLNLCILKNAQLNTLQYTIIERYWPKELQCNRDCRAAIKFSRLNLHLLIDGLLYDITTWLSLSSLDETKYEFLATKMNDSTDTMISLYATPLLEQFIRDNFTINVARITKVKELEFVFRKPSTISLWNKKSVIFENQFYRKLLNELKDTYIYNCNPNVDQPVPTMYECYSIAPSEPSVCKKEESVNYNPFKKRRLAPPSHMMNYDTLFKEKKDLQLIVSFPSSVSFPVTLSSNCEYLKKITFLSLSGSATYSVEFFNILFRCCDNLVTLDLELRPVGSHKMSSLFRSLPLNKTLKNFRLESNDLDFRTIFQSLSQSKMLENIHLVDAFVTKLNSQTTSKTYDPTLILSNCDNLYNIFILTTMTDSVLTSTLKLYNELKSRFNRHLNIDIKVRGKYQYEKYYRSSYRYNPFFDVFRFFRIMPSMAIPLS